tara:strand:+ start:209 stop:931 length:723 start_codon:yes stop_codon:yes gene_type:complete
MVKKVIAKKIAKTIKPKPKPKAPKQRIAQGNQPPGRTGTMQNPASKSVTKSKPNTTTAKKTTPKIPSPASKAVPVPKKGVSNTAKAAGTAAVVGAGVGGTKLGKYLAGESFDDAFRKARAKGEATLFTHNGKKYTAVTKDDLKRKGYSTLAAYNKAGGAKKVTANKSTDTKKKRKRPVINAVKRVLLGKDKKFGGDKGLIDFIRKPKKKADGGMINSSKPKRSSRRGVGAAKRGFGKALR